jgi:hypothetical protein
MTTAGGAILRDLARPDGGSAMLKTTLYAEIFPVGGLGMSLCIEAFGGPRRQILLIAPIGLVPLGCATARIVAQIHRTAMPPFEAKTPAETPSSAAATRSSNLAVVYLNAPRVGAAGTTVAQAANFSAGFANPAGVRYSGGATSDASRPRLRQLT